MRRGRSTISADLESPNGLGWLGVTVGYRLGLLQKWQKTKTRKKCRASLFTNRRCTRGRTCFDHPLRLSPIRYIVQSVASSHQPRKFPLPFLGNNRSCTSPKKLGYWHLVCMMLISGVWQRYYRYPKTERLDGFCEPTTAAPPTQKIVEYEGLTRLREYLTCRNEWGKLGAAFRGSVILFVERHEPVGRKAQVRH